MYSLPTFIRSTLDQYTSKRDLTDDYLRFGALQSVYATVIKFVGTTLALISADHKSDLRDEAWGAIFDSTSLGGWIQAANTVCRVSSGFSDEVRSYCDVYSAYGEHSSRDILDRITEHINSVMEQLANLGYKIRPGRRLNLLRALEHIVAIRNKCAHGVPDSLFFSRIEPALFSSLKLILTIIPFSAFTFWGKYGSSSLEFVEQPPRHRHRLPRGHFWVESDLLSSGHTESIPFLVYKADSRSIYCLNDKVTADSSESEFIDHSSGYIVYREVRRAWPQEPPSPSRLIRPRNYEQHIRTLSHDFRWHEIALTKSSIDSCTDDTGVYLFKTTTVRLSGHCAIATDYIADRYGNNWVVAT